MSSIWLRHAESLNALMRDQNEVQAHLYLEQLMLFPIDVQDKIIEEVCQLGNCSSEAIAAILAHYALPNSSPFTH
ncbi:MAG: hypothetical protein ACPGTQ_11060 [Colwellia sp.]